MKSGELLSGRYRVQKRLGSGGMGSVFLATVEALDDKKVAIKELNTLATGEEGERAAEQFRKEASFLANLNHPNLIPVTDFFVENNRSYLVMAYVEGDDLLRLMRSTPEGKFTAQQVTKWCRPLCKVLHYLHSQDPPVLFRDLKPSNIMLDKDGTIKLIDFGIARSGEKGSTTDTFLQGIGTAGFAAIEQHSGAETTDQRTDIYGLGATLYNLLTAEVPPDAAARAASLKRLKPLSKIDPDLPPRLCRAIAKCLEIKPENRYQNMLQLEQDLFEPLSELVEDDLNTVAFAKTQETTPAPENTSIWPKVSLVVLTLVLILVTFSFGGGSVAPEELDERRAELTLLDYPHHEEDEAGAAAAAFAGLTWLAENGAGFQLEEPHNFAAIFGDPDLLGAEFGDSIEVFIEGKAVKSYALESDGWLDREDDSLQHPYPYFELIEEALDSPKGTIWLQLGWYTVEDDKYHWEEKEWVNLVGLEEDTMSIVTHREGEARRQDLTIVELEKDATLDGDIEGLPIDGQRQVLLEGDFEPPHESDGQVPIIDYVMVLWVPAPT